MSNEATQILDDLLKTLDGRLAASGPSARGDAIDAVLAEPPRTTAVTSLRESPAVAEFRQALTDGLIRVDTANRLLTLINSVITRLVP